MFCLTFECVLVGLLFVVISDSTECCCFCRSVPFPGAPVHTGQGADMDICVRNTSWEVTHLATDSLSIPVPFHSCVDVHISHCSNVFCLSLQTQLAWLVMGQHIF